MNLFSPKIAKSLPRPLLLTALLALPYAAQAADPAPLALAPADQKAIERARVLTRTEGLLKQSMEWSETDSSLKQTMAHIQAVLGEDAPPIEVRTKSEVRSTFALSKVGVGTTLVSLAKLANAKLWVFASGVVIAPESALTAAETEALTRKEGGDWTRSQAASGSSAGWSGRTSETRVVVRLVGADVKAKLAAKGQTEPAVRPAPPAPVAPPTPGVPRPMPEYTPWAPFQLPFGELSPTSQGLILGLMKADAQRFARATGKEAQEPTVAPDALVGYDDTNTAQNQMFVRDPKLPSYQTMWSVSP